MEHRSRSAITHVAGVVAILLVTVVMHGLVDAYVLSVVETGEFHPLILQFGSVGDTVYVYTLFLTVVTYVIAPALIFTLGYRYGKSRSGPAFEG